MSRMFLQAVEKHLKSLDKKIGGKGREKVIAELETFIAKATGGTKAELERSLKRLQEPSKVKDAAELVKIREALEKVHELIIENERYTKPTKKRSAKK